MRKLLRDKKALWRTLLATALSAVVAAGGLTVIYHSSARSITDPISVLSVAYAAISVGLIFKYTDGIVLAVLFPIWIIFMEMFPSAWVSGDIIHIPTGSLLSLFMIIPLTPREQL